VSTDHTDEKLQALISEKKDEILHDLQQWVENHGISAQGFQIQFSLVAVPVVHVVEVIQKPESAMSTLCTEFFTHENFREAGVSVGVNRILNCLVASPPYINGQVVDFRDLTLEQFLEHVGSRELMRMPNFGKKSCQAIERLLTHNGLINRDLW
jgi:hypothetical protein